MSLLVDDLQLLAILDKEPSYRRERVDLLSLAADAVSATAVHSASHPVDLGPLHTAADPTAPGRGCTFRLVLPAADSGQEPR